MSGPVRKPELLAPAGDWACARAAVANGADAIFFGLPAFNARLRAENFSEDDLSGLMGYLHERGRKGYLTVNTLVFTGELREALKLLQRATEARVDAIIIQDVGLASLAQDCFPNLELHASTQMTLTSPEGLGFAKRLGIRRAVVARELSLRDLAKFNKAGVLPLETFVHGALCVAYSGQCLTSEALGQRSANRGECAQACRLPYRMVVDGVLRDLGDKRYLLSPQDLAAVREIPDLVELGIESFKIEGRLKSPEYVAAVTGVYRKAIDACFDPGVKAPVTREDWYRLEMTFSRGLFSGWMHGVNHQKLVHGRFGKKRGAYVGTVHDKGRDWVETEPGVKVAAGDGVVFDVGGDPDKEQGGRVHGVEGGRLRFGRGDLDMARIPLGARIWKTDDPQLNKVLRQSFARDVPPQAVRVDVRARGAPGEPLRLRFVSGIAVVEVESAMPLVRAEKRPLTAALLREQLGRLGGTGFVLGEVEVHLDGDCLLPIRELNRMRREAVARLAAAGVGRQEQSPPRVRMERGIQRVERLKERRGEGAEGEVLLSALCRTDEQVAGAMAAGCEDVLLDFEDIRRFGPAVEAIREGSKARVWLATPRIQKAGEEGFFRLIAGAKPDGVLVRNLGALQFFREAGLALRGDFSLNVANPVTAEVLMGEGLESVTVSYDLNADQVLDLLGGAPAGWFEIVLHQHMPMFHMEHCVFAAFLSEGTDHTNCGRPCERHEVRLEDRVGARHLLKADVGCRNTLFHQRAQSGAAFFKGFRAAGVRRFRVEFLDESRDRAAELYRSYRRLLEGVIEPERLLTEVGAAGQLGVTSGTLTVLG